MNAWYGFDFDGTLSRHASGDPIDTVGLPIAPMVDLVKDLLARGHEVRIVTARVSPEWDDQAEQTAMIQDWCEKHIGMRLVVQAHKDGGMIALYDDRAYGVVRNTGKLLHEVHRDFDTGVAAAVIQRVFYERTGIQMDTRVAFAISEEIYKS